MNLYVYQMFDMLPVSDPAAAAMTGALCSSGDGLLENERENEEQD